MVNGISDILKGGSQFVREIGVGSQGSGNKALAQNLIRQSQQTRNPLVAALTGFTGASALQNIQRRDEESEQERLGKAEALQEKEFGLQERRVDIQERQANRDFNLANERLNILKEKTNKEIEKINKELSAVPSGRFDPEKEVKIESSLRKEYTDLSKEFVKERDAFGRIQASAKDPSAAGDLALIFNYMKLLDPGSTVREGEFANAQNAGNIPQSLLGQYNRLVKGEGRLAPDLRVDFLDRANKLFERASVQQSQTTEQFKGLAERANVDFKDVIIDLGAATVPDNKSDDVLIFNKAFSGSVPSGALDVLKNNFNDQKIRKQFQDFYGIDPNEVFKSE